MRLTQFIILLLVFALLSCEKEYVNKDSLGSDVVFRPRFGTDYSIQSGILKFSSLDTYLKTIEVLSKKTDKDRSEFGNEQGFISFYSKFYDNYRKIINSEKEADRISAINSKYTVLQNGFPHINMGNSSVSAVVNEDGLVYIGKTLFRFKNDQEIIVKNGSIDTAMNPEIADTNDVVILNTRVSGKAQGSPNARVPGTCNSLKGSTGNFSAGCSVIANVYADQYPLDYDYIKYRVVYTIKTEAESHKIFGNYSGTPTLNLSYVLNVFDHDGQSVARLNTFFQVTNTMTYTETISINDVYSFTIPYFSVQLQKNSVYGNGSVVNPSTLRFTEFIIGSCGVTAECYN